MGEVVTPGSQATTVKDGTNISFQCPVLSVTNYPIWSLRIKAIFKAHGLWETIEPGTNVDSKKDNAAIAYLYQALPEDLILQIASCETAKEIWDSIKTRHLGAERVMEARLQSLKIEFDLLRMKEEEKVDDFVAKLSGIASKASTLGSAYEEAVLVRKLLTSVPDSYLNMVATIEQLVDLKTVKFQEIVGRLKAYEERTSSRTGKPKQEQLLLSYEEWESKKKQERSTGRGRGTGHDTRGKGRGRGRSSGRGRGSNRNHGGNDNAKKDRSKLQCFKCDGFGHFSADCPTRKQDNQANLNQAAPLNRNQANADEPALLMAVATSGHKELIYLTEDKVFPTKYQSHDGQLTWYLDTVI